MIDSADLRRLADRVSLRAWLGLAVALVAYAVVAAGGLLTRSPLGHDEAVYALRGRDFMEGWSRFSGGYWADYRAPGLPMVLSVVNRVVGAHVLTMRLTVVVLGAVVLVCTWFLGRRLGAGRPAIAPFLLALTTGFVYAATTVLADVPGAAFGLPAVIVYLLEVERGRLRWSFLAVPVLTAMATASRFGAPFMIGAGLASAFLVTAPAVVRARNWMVVAQSACLAVGTALITWLLLMTTMLSGAVSIGNFSPADANRELVGGKGLNASTGFADFKQVVNPWSGYPVPLWSKPVALLFLVGVVAAWIGVATRRTAWRPVVFGTVAGVLATTAVIVTVGLVVANYLALSLPYWAIVSGSGLGWMWREFHAFVVARRRWVAVAGLAVAAVVGAVLVAGANDDTNNLHGRQQFSFDALRNVSVEAGRQLGPDCLLVTSYAPQAGYYSGCSVMPWAGWNTDLSVTEVIRAAVERPQTFNGMRHQPTDFAALIVESGKRQPANEDLLASPALGATLVEVGSPGDGRIHVWVQRVRDCVLDRSC